MSRSYLKSAGNSSARARLRPALLRKKLCAAVLLALAAPAYSLPQGGQVVAGDATIAVTGDVMDIQQDSQRAILNFHSFDIAQQQAVNFHQPGADAVALSRVLGDRLSEIHGALNANGQVYLINPNGVVFGNGAEINVGSLVVTTLDMTDGDFLAGRDAFSGTTSGRVENNGHINADGRVVLLAPEVVNRGEIQVPDGEIVMQASRQALLHTPGSEIPILVEDADFIGKVVNEGTLAAGEVALVLESGNTQTVYDAAINNSGMVRAVRGTGEGGEIHLLADSSIVNSGTLDASAQAGDGGTVVLEAAAINQSGAIDATASGDGKGGDIHLTAANAIAMHSGSTIDASADQHGDAGDVVVIAEKSTWFTEDASIKARGGEGFGDGGFVEVSGREFISVSGEVDAGASNGDAGSWLIDPTDISIVSGGIGADDGGAFAGTDPHVWNAQFGVSTASISIVSLHNALVNNSDVRITTASSASGEGNITFDTVLNYNNLGTNKSLTLEADGDIIFTENGGIWDSEPGTADGINFIATAGRDFKIVDGLDDVGGSGVIFTGTGTIDITATRHAHITGLASFSTAPSAIRVRALEGEIRENGDKLWDAIILSDGGSIELSGHTGIYDLRIGDPTNHDANPDDEVTPSDDITYLNAVSAAGSISGVRSWGNLVITQLGSADSASVSALGELAVETGALLSGNSFIFESDELIIIPNGLTVPGSLQLTAPDITDPTSTRTLNFGAGSLVIDTEAVGGDLTINSDVDTLSVINRSVNTITVTDVDDLILGIMAPQVGNISVSTGSETDLTLAEDINLTSMTGALELTAGRDLLINAAIQDGSDITLEAPRNVIFSADGAVDVGSGNISIGATNGNVALGHLSGGSMLVTAGGAITDANGDEVNLVGTSATLTAGGTIGTLTNGLEATLNSLNLNATGGAFLANSQALTLSSVTTGGDLNIHLPTAGDLTLTQAAPAIGGHATFSVAAGDLILPAAGLDLSGRDLTITADAIVDGDSAVTLSARDANITLNAAAGSLTSTFETLVLNIAGGTDYQVENTGALVLRELNSSRDVDVSAASLEVQDIVLAGDNITLTFDAATALTQTGTLSSTAGADNVALNFTSGSAMTINGNLRDANGESNRYNFDFSAGGDFSMDNGAQIGAWDGGIIIQSAAGDVTVTGLSSTSDAVDAIQLEASAGEILSANAAGRDIEVADGGFVATALGSITDLDVESLYFSASSTMGNISLSEATGTSARQLQTSGSAQITTGNELNLAEATLAVRDLIIDAGDDLVIADSGLTVSGDLTIAANTIRDSNANLSLQAANADIALRDIGAQARTWTTAFDQLVLSIAGTGDLTLNDENVLALTSISATHNVSVMASDGSLTVGGATLGGNAAFTATDGDVVFSSAPAVTGNLSLTTVGSGDVVVPDAGLSVGGNLTLVADDLRDSDADLTLAAANATITLRNADTHARDWTTTFEQLVLDIAGTGDFALADTDSLTLTSVATGGSAHFSATSGDLVFTDAPAVGGDLSLTTIGSGDVVLPSAEFSVGGDLTVDADDLRASDADFDLAAVNASITLRNSDNQARRWTTNFEQLALDLAGAGSFELTNSGSLTLTSATLGGSGRFTTATGDLVVDAADIGGDADFAADAGSVVVNGGTIDGSASFTAGGGDLLFTAAPTLGGNLSLVAAGTGEVVLADAGLTIAGDLVVDASDLRGSDGELYLAASDAAITLRDSGSQARSWNTNFDQLTLAINGSGDFALTDADSLTLAAVTTGGNASFRTTAADLIIGTDIDIGGDLRLSTIDSGELIIADSGLLHSAGLSIEADTVRSGAAAVTLGATAADITLRDGAEATSWETRFDELVLQIAGGGDFQLTDADGLTLTSVTTAGSASFTTTGSDLVLADALAVGGPLTLATTGQGDVVLSETGLVHGGDVVIRASNLRGADADADLTLAATAADIRLRQGATAQTWNTDLDRLSVSIGGSGALTVVDSDGLILESVAVGGDASFSSTDADLQVISAPMVAGTLSLAAEGSGDLILPETGLVHSGELILAADQIATGDADLRLSAAAVSATLRDQQQATNWQTSIQQLTLSLVGGGAFNLTNAGPLVVESLTSDGAVDVTTPAGLQIGSLSGADMAFRGADIELLQSEYNLTGALSLTAANQLQLAAAGLAVPGELRLQAAGVNAAGDGPVILAAESADLIVTGEQALTLSTRLSELGLSYGGRALSIGNDRNLLLSRFAVPNLETLSLAASGTLTVPAAGLAASQRINIEAEDLLDGDRTLVLSAPELAVRLGNAGGDHQWTLDADSLDVLLRGNANLSVVAEEGLTLADLNGDAQAVLVENGNFSLSLNSGDLTLAGNVSAADLSADGRRAGVIDLTVARGSVYTSGPVTLLSRNTLDQTAGTAADRYGIRIRLTDTEATERTITLGDASGSATLRAIGGDVLLDTRPDATAAEATRTLVHTSNSIIEVYNNLGDAPSGQVFVNGEPATAQPWQTVRANRLLAIVTDVPAQDTGDILDELDDLDGSTDIVKDVDKSGPQAASQFDQVFGTCDELDQKNQHRCRVDAALKSFLSHWLVGGEMPPKSEIR